MYKSSLIAATLISTMMGSVFSGFTGNVMIQAEAFQQAIQAATSTQAPQDLPSATPETEAPVEIPAEEAPVTTQSAPTVRPTATPKPTKAARGTTYTLTKGVRITAPGTVIYSSDVTYDTYYGKERYIMKLLSDHETDSYYDLNAIIIPGMDMTTLTVGEQLLLAEDALMYDNLLNFSYDTFTFRGNDGKLYNGLEHRGYMYADNEYAVIRIIVTPRALLCFSACNYDIKAMDQAEAVLDQLVID